MVTKGVRQIENFYDVPFIGPWPAKFGKIIELWDTACSPSPELWVQAFWHEIPFLVWAILKPDPIDLVTDRFKVQHHRKRKRKFKVIDAWQPKFPVPKGKITNAVFDMIQAQQRIGWYLLIVDASLDFTINWMSAAYNWNGCAVPDAKWARGRAENTTHILPAADNFPLPIWEDRSQNGFFADINTMDSPVGYDVTCNVSLSYQTTPVGDDHHFDGTFNLVDWTTQLIMDTSTPFPQPDGSVIQEFSIRDWSAIKPAHVYGVASTCDHVSWVNFQGSTIELYGTKHKGMTFDP